MLWNPACCRSSGGAYDEVSALGLGLHYYGGLFRFSTHRYPSPTLDVPATVEAAVEATRTVDRSVQATSEAWAEATRAALPTATPVVMTIYAPTPEPYVAAPGTIEQGIDELYTCLQDSDEFRAFFLSSFEQSGAGHESAETLFSMFLEDKDLFVEAMLLAAEEESEYASMLSLIGGMAMELCGPAAEVPLHDLGMSDADAEALLDEVYDCYNSDSRLQALLMASVGNDPEGRLLELLMSNRELFVTSSLIGARQDPDVAEMLESLDLLLEAVCR